MQATIRAFSHSTVRAVDRTTPLAQSLFVRIGRTNRYLKDLKRLGASQDDVRTLEAEVANHPSAGDVTPGLGGIRKIRFGFGNKGKRSGARAIYFVMVGVDTAVMLFA